jgi:hypothetical protein
MTKTLQYLYVGENGSILSPVKLLDVYHIKKYKLIADANCQITKDGVHFHNTVVVPESEVNLWYEVKSN